MNGNLFPVKHGFATYMIGWYDRLFSDTKAVTEFAARGHQKAMMFAPGRMVDAVEEMLKSYQKNQNSSTPGDSARFPIVIIGMAKDYVPTTGDWGGRQVGRKLVSFLEATVEDPNPSVYGYRQAMGDVRTQVAIMAAEEATAKSLATQFVLWVGDIPNRRFTANFVWGQYTLAMPVMIENPDILFTKQDLPDSKNMTILVADVDLKCVFPYPDAPKEGEPNDGSTHIPPGYPVVDTVVASDQVSLMDSQMTDAGTVWGSPGDFDEPPP